MARICRNSGAIAVAGALLFALFTMSASAQYLFDRPVLAVDPEMHASTLWSLAVDRSGRFAVTGGGDGTIRVWSTSDGLLLKKIRIPAGPTGIIYAVAISPDGSTVAAGGLTSVTTGYNSIFVFDRESGALAARIQQRLTHTVNSLVFSTDGRLLAATLQANAGPPNVQFGGGLRVYDRDNKWQEVFEDVYAGDSYRVDFASDGRLATTSWAGRGTVASLRLYSPDFRTIVGPVTAPHGKPGKIAFSPDGNLLAVSYQDFAAIDTLNAHSLVLQGTNWNVGPGTIDALAWPREGGAIRALGHNHTTPIGFFPSPKTFASYVSHCGANSTAGIALLPDGDIILASEAQCLTRIRGDESVWTITSATADLRGQPDGLKVSSDGQLVDFGFAYVPQSERLTCALFALLHHQPIQA